MRLDPENSHQYYVIRFWMLFLDTLQRLNKTVDQVVLAGNTCQFVIRKIEEGVKKWFNERVLDHGSVNVGVLVLFQDHLCKESECHVLSEHCSVLTMILFTQT